MRIAVVGAGIAGLMSAWMLARAGHGVVVFEKGTVGCGASGRALGVLVPISLDRPIDRLQRQGIGMWPALAAELAVESGVVIGDFWREWGDGRQQLRLPLLFEVLVRAIRARGGEIREGVEVGETPALLADGFDRVVLAAGWGNQGLTGKEMGISAGLAVRVRAEVAELVVSHNLFVCPDWDGTVLAGSLNWDEERPGDGVVSAAKLAELREKLGLVRADLAEAEIVEAWVGYRPKQAPRLPLVTEVGDGIVAVTGLGKTGLGLAPVVGDAVVKGL